MVDVGDAVDVADFAVVFVSVGGKGDAEPSVVENDLRRVDVGLRKKKKLELEIVESIVDR